MATEKVQVTAIIDGKQAINELGKLEIAQSELKNEIKSLGGSMREYENALKKLDKYKVGKENFEAAKKEVERLNSFIGRYDNLLKSANNTLAKTSEGTAEYGRAKAKVDVLTNSVSNYKTQLEAANKEVKKNENASKQFDKQDKEVKQLASSVKKYDDALKRASDNQKKIEETTASMGVQAMTMRQLRKEARKLKEELDNTVAGSPKYNELSNRFKEINTQIRSQNDALNNTQTGWKKFTGSFASFGAMAAGVIGGEIVMQAFQWITSFVVGIATGAAKISDELSNIQKTTGMTAEEVKTLNSELGKIDTRSSSADLREIARVAGQLGIPKDEIRGFTEQVDKMNVALGDDFSGGDEQITKEIGGIKKLFKETKDLKADEAMSRIGSAMNALGASGSATAPEIADFTNRIGALGNLAPQITEVMGLGTALSELGLPVEQAAGGVTNIILNAGKNLDAYAAQIGITKEQFKDLLNNDPNEMFLRLADSMQGLDNDQIIAVLKNLKVDSQEAVKVMSQLAINTDLVREKQALAAVEFEKNTSLQAEFNLKNENFAASLAKAGKAWNAFVAGIGSTFQPIMQVALDLFTKLFSKTEKAPDSLQPLIKVFNTLWSSLKTIFGAMWEVIKVFNIFDGEGDAWKTTIKILAFAVEVLAFQFNLLATVINKAKNDFIAFYNESETFRRVVSGSIAAVKQLFAGFFKTVGDGFSVMRDLLTAISTGDLKKFEAALTKSLSVVKDLFWDNGKDIANAFYDGFGTGSGKIEIKPKVSTEEAVKQLQDFTKKQADLIAKVSGLKKVSSSDKDPILQELDFYSSSTEEQRKAIDAKVNELIKTNNQRLFASNNKSAGKKANSDADKLIEDFKKFQEKIREYQEEESMNTLSGENKEVLEAQMKYAALIEEAKKFKVDKAKIDEEILKIEELQNNEITEIRKKFAAEEERLKEEKEKAKADAQKQIDDSFKSDFELEILAVEDKYNTLIALAKQYGLDTVALELAKANAIDAIHNKQTESQTNKTIEENEKQRQASFQFANSLTDLFTATNNLMGEQSAGYLEFQKMITIAQLAIDTASAISSITSKSAATSITPIDMAIKIASGIAIVIGNIAKAKQVLSTANTPTAPKFSKGGKINIQGNSHANGGIAMVNNNGQKVGEMEGGESYLLLSKNTTKNNSPLINALLQSSQTNGAAVVPNFAAMQQAIRTSNTTINNTTNQNSNSDELLMRLIAETRMNREAFETMKRESKSYIVYSEFKDVDDKMNSIKNYSGQ